MEKVRAWCLAKPRIKDGYRTEHTSFGARSFDSAAHKIWNSLPPSLRTSTSPDTFRRHLKTHYCQQAFQST